MSSKKNEIKIDTSLIPPEIENRLARAGVDFYFRLINTPGMREKLDEYKRTHPTS